MNLLRPFRRMQFFCIYHYLVTMRLVREAQPLSVSNLPGDEWRDGVRHSYEEPCTLTWHRPDFAMDDAPAFMGPITIAKASLRISPINRRFIRRDQAQLVTFDGHLAIVPPPSIGVGILGYLAGIAHGQPAAEEWILTGQTSQLSRPQVVVT